MVAKGHGQKKDVNFNEVFSPVVNHSSIHVILAMITIFDLKLEKLDVKIVFLHDELEKQIYMQQLEGFVIPEKKRLCVPIEKIFVWIETVSKVVAQGV